MGNDLGEKTFAQVGALFPWSAVGRAGMERDGVGAGKVVYSRWNDKYKLHYRKKFLPPKIYFLSFTFTI